MPEDAAAAKPRVLLSILKGEGFEALGDTSDLYTTIIAGFGRFECERVLKPSGVELMNLAQSAIIEISVQRRHRETQQGQLLYRGRLPLAQLQQPFAQHQGDNGLAGGEAQVWESWLGLFSADVSLKGQSAERIFQQCLEMGASPSRTTPRLFLRLQYLQPGATAAPRVVPSAPSIAGQLQDNMQMSVVGQLASHQQVGVMPPTAGATASKQRLTPMRGTEVQCGAITTAWQQRSPGVMRNQSPGASVPASDRSRAPLLAEPSPAPAAQPLAHRSSAQRGRSGSRTFGDPNEPGIDWRAKCEELTQALERTKDSKASERHDRLLEAEVARLSKEVADLKLAREEVELQNVRLHSEELARQDSLKTFFEQVARPLGGLGWPLKSTPAEAAATAESAASQLSQIAAALEDSLQARSTANDAPSAEWQAAEQTGLLGEAVWQAVEGGEAAFEDWFCQLDANARSGLAKATRLLSGCRQAALLRNAVAATTAGTEEATSCAPITGALYLPVKTDQVDLLVASTLLRLSNDPATSAAVTTAAAGLLRLEAGKYRLGPDGARISCFVDNDRLMVQVPSGNTNEARSDPVEFGEFIIRT